MKWADLVKRSTMTYIELYLCEVRGNPTMKSMMIGIDSSTDVTLGHILRYLLLHSRPPEFFLQNLIHLVGSRMDRIPQVMSLIHDLAAKLEVLQNHKTVLEPYDSIDILSEALNFSQL
jgi:hypothetical protein